MCCSSLWDRIDLPQHWLPLKLTKWIQKFTRDQIKSNALRAATLQYKAPAKAKADHWCRSLILLLAAGVSPGPPGRVLPMGFRLAGRQVSRHKQVGLAGGAVRLACGIARPAPWALSSPPKARGRLVQVLLRGTRGAGARGRRGEGEHTHAVSQEGGTTGGGRSSGGRARAARRTASMWARQGQQRRRPAVACCTAPWPAHLQYRAKSINACQHLVVFFRAVPLAQRRHHCSHGPLEPRFNRRLGCFSCGALLLIRVPDG